MKIKYNYARFFIFIVVFMAITLTFGQNYNNQEERISFAKLNKGVAYKITPYEDLFVITESALDSVLLDAFWRTKYKKLELDRLKADSVLYEALLFNVILQLKIRKLEKLLNNKYKNKIGYKDDYF